MELALRSPVRRRRRSELSAPPLGERLATLVEQSALELIDPDKIKALAEDMRVIERNRVHHVGLVVSSVVLSAMQRSTDTEGRWLDAQRTYEDLGGAEAGKTSFRNQVLKMVPVMNRLLRRRMMTFSKATKQPELRGRLAHFADVLIPDGCAFKLAAALSNVYAGTGQPSELKLHAVYSLRTEGVISTAQTAGSVHDSDGFWPEKWQSGALYIWDLGFVNNERIVEAVNAGAYPLQRLKTGANPVVLASYGPTGNRRELLDDDGKLMRLDAACEFGAVHRQRVLDLDVRIDAGAQKSALARAVCVPFGGEDRYYLTTLPRAIFTPHDIAELYRMRWEIELFFRGWKGALRLDEVRRLQHPLALDAAIIASLLASTLTQSITAGINELERLAADEAFSP